MKGNNRTSGGYNHGKGPQLKPGLSMEWYTVYTNNPQTCIHEQHYIWWHRQQQPLVYEVHLCASTNLWRLEIKPSRFPNKYPRRKKVEAWGKDDVQLPRQKAGWVVYLKVLIVSTDILTWKTKAEPQRSTKYQGGRVDRTYTKELMPAIRIASRPIHPAAIECSVKT